MSSANGSVSSERPAEMTAPGPHGLVAERVPSAEPSKIEDELIARRKADDDIGKAILCMLALGAMVLLMWKSLHFQLPTGKFLSATDFVLLWFRELIVLTMAALFMLLLVVGWIVQCIRKMTGGKNAHGAQGPQASSTEPLLPPQSHREP